MFRQVDNYGYIKSEKKRESYSKIFHKDGNFLLAINNQVFFLDIQKNKQIGPINLPSLEKEMVL